MNMVPEHNTGEAFGDIVETEPLAARSDETRKRLEWARMANQTQGGERLDPGTEERMMALLDSFETAVIALVEASDPRVEGPKLSITQARDEYCNARLAVEFTVTALKKATDQLRALRTSEDGASTL